MQYQYPEVGSNNLGYESSNEIDHDKADDGLKQSAQGLCCSHLYSIYILVSQTSPFTRGGGGGGGGGGGAGLQDYIYIFTKLLYYFTDLYNEGYLLISMMDSNSKRK